MKLFTFPIVLSLAAVAAGAGDAIADSGRANAGRSGGIPSSNEKEALAIVVTKWDAACSGNTRRPWDNMVDAWYDDQTDTRSAPRGHGSKAWNRDGIYRNGDVVDSRFTDTSHVNWGADHENDNVDADDAVMVGLHGGHFSPVDGWVGSMRVNESGSGNCNAWQGDMFFGNCDLEFLHLSSCHSLCDWSEGWDFWKATFDRLHQVNGFYGVMWISSIYTGRYSSFSDDAFDISIGDSWVDNQYSRGFWTGGHDHCPVSMASGGSTSAADYRLSNEEYDFVFDDPNTPPKFDAMWMCGCDPKGHNP